MTIIFMVGYIGLTILAGFVKGLLGTKVVGSVNLGFETMQRTFKKNDLIAPLSMFKASRMQMDQLELEPDYRIRALSELPELLGVGQSARP